MTRYAPLIAHRGMSSLAPENTLAAFAACADHGVAAFEFDVDVMGDGTLLVIHDNTLERTTSGQGGYYQRDYGEVAALDAGSWFAPEFSTERLPRLGDVIALMNDRELDANLEIKPSESGPRLRAALIEGIAREIEALDAQRHLVISSFDPQLLAMMAQAAPGVELACLFDSQVPVDVDTQLAFDAELAAAVRAAMPANADLENAPARRAQETAASGRRPGHATGPACTGAGRAEALVDGWIALARHLGARHIHPDDRGLSASAVQAMRGAGFGVNVWTVNDLERAAELTDWGVSALITDRPQDFPAAARTPRPL